MNKTNSKVDQTLDLALIRMTRKNRNAPLPKGMGDMIDSLEAKLNELQLQASMLTSQAEIERKKAEALVSQISIQVKTAEDEILKFLNDYQKQIYDQIYSQVKVSEESLKFKGTDIYDLSFITNFDYSKVKIYNDKTLLQQRPDRREEFRVLMSEYKMEVQFAQGLITKTDPKDFMYGELYNQRNYYIKQYYYSAIQFYQESTIIGFLNNPTNNLENLKEFISLNESNLPNQRKSVESNRLKIGEEAYKNESARLDFLERMLVTAKARLKYLMLAYEAKWAAPSLAEIDKYAVEKDITYSKAVKELNDLARQTLCIPDWVLAIAEMYNLIQRYEEPLTDLNPYDARWIRKAKEVINLESEVVNYTAQKLFKAIDQYWLALAGGIADLEDYHMDIIIAKAIAEDTTPVSHYMVVNDFNFVDFSEDLTIINKNSSTIKGFSSSLNNSTMGSFDEQTMGFHFSLKSIVKPFVSLAKSVAKVVKKIDRVVAKAIKQTLDNTLGRVLPASVYDKIANITDAGLEILKGNLNNNTFRKVVKGVTDIALIGGRIFEEAWKQADKVGALHNLMRTVDKYSGGVLTSIRNLNRVPITIGTGGKIDWKTTLIDALKVGLAVGGASSLATVASNLAQQTAISYTIAHSGKDIKESALGRGALTAAAMIATGQSSLADEAVKGAKKLGTTAAINNTSLGQTDLGRSIAAIGVNAAIDYVATNDAFSDAIKKEATKEIKRVATVQAKKKTVELIVGKKQPTKKVVTAKKKVVTVKKTPTKKDGKVVSTIPNPRISPVENASQLDDQGSLVDQEVTYDEYSTIAELMDEGKAYYKEYAAQYPSLDEDTKNFILVETDHYFVNRMEEVYGTLDVYGQQLSFYLIMKYGPQESYENFATPDDFLNFQTVYFTEIDRLTNIDWGKTSNAIGIGIGVAALATALAATNA